MREGYVVADGEEVGLVCLSVQYKNSGMFVAHDMKTHASLPTSKRVREACLSVVNDFLLATRQAPTSVARARNSQHRFRDQTRAGIGRFFVKKGSGAYPSPRGATSLVVARTDLGTGYPRAFVRVSGRRFYAFFCRRPADASSCLPR